MERLIKKRSIIVAADVNDLSAVANLVQKTAKISGVGGYKIGFSLGLKYGLAKVVKVIKTYTGKPIIYDHQKGGTDIPELGENFARICRQAGVDAVILFPFGGAKTERFWIKACQNEGLVVLIGAHMTQEEFLQTDGGFISNNAPEKIFTIAAKLGVYDFVVPGNKVEYIKIYKRLLEKLLGKDNFTLYAPGFVSQRGRVTETAKVAGKFWHAIVGRAIYEAVNPGKAAELLCQGVI